MSKLRVTIEIDMGEAQRRNERGWVGWIIRTVADHIARGSSSGGVDSATGVQVATYDVAEFTAGEA